MKTILSNSSNQTSFNGLTPASIDSLKAFEICIWICNGFGSSVVFLVILTSRPKMIALEFFALTMYVLFLLTSQVSIIVFTSMSLFYPMMQFTISGGAFSFVFIILDSSTSSTLIYYSVYQFSMLSRNKFMLRIYELLKQPKTFLIYQFVAVLFFILINGLFLTRFISEYNVQLLFELFWRNVYTIMIESCVTRAVLTSFYFISTVFVIVTKLTSRSSRNPESRHVSASYPNDTATRRYRRNVRLMIKFMIIPLIYVVHYVPKIFLLVMNLDLENSLGPKLINCLCDFLFFGGPLTLVYVHNILKRTLLDHLAKCFRCIFCSRLGLGNK